MFPGRSLHGGSGFSFSISLLKSSPSIYQLAESQAGLGLGLLAFADPCLACPPSVSGCCSRDLPAPIAHIVSGAQILLGAPQDPATYPTCYLAWGCHFSKLIGVCRQCTAQSSCVRQQPSDNLHPSQCNILLLYRRQDIFAFINLTKQFKIVIYNLTIITIKLKCYCFDFNFNCPEITNFCICV